MIEMTWNIDRTDNGRPQLHATWLTQAPTTDSAQTPVLAQAS